MRDLLKSMTGFTWAMGLFGLSRIGRMIFPQAGATPEQEAAAFDRLTRAAMAGLRSQPPSEDPVLAPAADSVLVDRGRLDLSRMVVLGEGLAAGMGSFSLSSESQARSFAARVAAQTGAGFSQRLIQPPGIGDAPGFPRLPVRLPGVLQTTVVEPFPGPELPGDLSVPGYRAADAVEFRPCPPLVWRDDARQTAANLILGLRGMMAGAQQAYPTQLEMAVAARPTFAIVCLGFYEALQAAIEQDLSRLPESEPFAESMERIISELRDSGAEVLVLTVPDPLNTAHFSTLETAARVAKVERSLLQRTYDLHDDDLITPLGLIEIGNHFLSQAAGPLGNGMVLPGGTGRCVSTRVEEWNRRITRAAEQSGAVFFDLNELLRCVKRNGVRSGNRLMSADYLGGFYSLNGYYPGDSGHVVIANEILNCLNAVYGAGFSPVDLAATLRNDPVAMYENAVGPNWTSQNMAPGWPLTEPAGEGQPECDPGILPQFPLAELSTPHPPLVEAGPQQLRLPPGLDQTLPLCRDSSYFGEAIRGIDCRSAEDAKYGSCPQLLFNGLVMVDSHLSGNLRIRFRPPVNDIAHFEISMGDGLTGDDSTLVAPILYKLPFRQNRLTDIPGLVSSGDLNLSTGDVQNLSLAVGIETSGLFALGRVNPKFPRQPITFPGQYGSSWARFEQRPDGQLDFTFFGSTFLPLGADLGGNMLRLPLPFSGPAMQFASIPARGTVMHPHVCLSTKRPDLSQTGSAPHLPENTVEEYTLFAHNTSFGDHFSLKIPEFGGDGTGRSHLMGRVEIQFGKRNGNSIPVAISSLPPGGLFIPFADSPLSQAFPGRLPMGPFGFDEALRFPLRTYRLEGVSFFDDPFDISVGAVDVRSGNTLTDLLHRGFLDQDVFLALLRIEPRTPKSSFYFRGPARFECGPTGHTTFRLLSHVLVPFPAGFHFPQPDLAVAYTAGENSILDPFFWLQAMCSAKPPHLAMSGDAHEVTASTGDLFSYSYRIPGADGGPAEFEYVNHTQDGSFKMHTLCWSSFLRSQSPSCDSQYDAVAFSGFGVWSKDGVRETVQASVQISRSDEFPYVGILINAGAVSNVNTKPKTLAEARP